LFAALLAALPQQGSQRPSASRERAKNPDVPVDNSPERM
jgi:hypothetical protein